MGTCATCWRQEDNFVGWVLSMYQHCVSSGDGTWAARLGKCYYLLRHCTGPIYLVVGDRGHLGAH